MKAVREIPNLKESRDDDMRGPPGHFAYFVGNANKETCGMTIFCPGCGKMTALTFTNWSGNNPENPTPMWTWDGNEEAPTLKPSIVHAVERGGCGWHGWLTAGEFHT